MKRFIFATIILFVIGTMAYAQAAQLTSAQIRQNAQQLLTQSRANAAQFQASFNQLVAANTSNADAVTFNQLRADLIRLETRINQEEARIRTTVENNGQVSIQVFNQFERLIGLYNEKIAELEAFIAN